MPGTDRPRKRSHRAPAAVAMAGTVPARAGAEADRACPDRASAWRGTGHAGGSPVGCSYRARRSASSSGVLASRTASRSGSTAARSGSASRSAAESSRTSLAANRSPGRRAPVREQVGGAGTEGGAVGGGEGLAVPVEHRQGDLAPARARRAPRRRRPRGAGAGRPSRRRRRRRPPGRRPRQPGREALQRAAPGLVVDHRDDPRTGRPGRGRPRPRPPPPARRRRRQDPDHVVEQRAVPPRHGRLVAAHAPGAPAGEARLRPQSRRNTAVIVARTLRSMPHAVALEQQASRARGVMDVSNAAGTPEAPGRCSSPRTPDRGMIAPMPQRQRRRPRPTATWPTPSAPSPWAPPAPSRPRRVDRISDARTHEERRRLWLDAAELIRQD